MFEYPSSSHFEKVTLSPVQKSICKFPNFTMDTLSTISNKFVNIVEYTGSELKFNSDNLSYIFKPHLEQNEDSIVAFVGLLGAEQNEETCTCIANLVHNVTSSEDQGSPFDWVTSVAGIIIWDKPLKQVKDGKTCLIWFLHISLNLEKLSECDSKLMKLALMMCSRVFRVVLTDEATQKIISEHAKSAEGKPKTMTMNKKSLNILSDRVNTKETFRKVLANLSEIEGRLNLLCTFTNDNIKNPMPLTDLLGGSEELIVEMEETSEPSLDIGEEGNGKLLEALDTETTVNEAKRVDAATTEFGEITLKPFGMDPEQKIMLVEARNTEVKCTKQETTDNEVLNSNVDTAADKEDKNSIQATNEQANVEKEEHTEPARSESCEEMTLNVEANTTLEEANWTEKKVAAGERKEKSEIDMNPTLNEVMATAFYNKVMANMLTERKDYFSATQFKRIHSELYEKMLSIFDISVDGDQAHINRFRETLNERFTFHKQTNIMILRTKVKQLESIIHKLKTLYIKKLDEIHSGGEPHQGNLEVKLEQKLKLEIWSKIGPTEPSEVHWESLKFQVRNLKGLHPAEAPYKEEGYLGFQLTYGNILMGTQKNGKYIQLNNEHGQDRTPAIVGLTKVNTLVYGSQVSRAEKKGALQKKYHVGKYFEPEGENFNPDQKYEISVKNKVCQVGIEFILGLLFKKLKTSAERQLNIKMPACVITVPFYFASFQRLQIKYGATAAGFKEVTILSDSYVSVFKFACDLNLAENDCSRNLQILSENNGNLYAGVYTFDTNNYRQCCALRESACGYKRTSKEVRNDEDEVTNLMSELKALFDKRNPPEGRNKETLSKYILIHWENDRWRKIMTSACCKMTDGGANVITVFPLEGAIGMYSNLKEQTPEFLRHAVQSSSKTLCQTDANRTQFVFSVTEEETHFTQRLFGSLVNPLGNLRVKCFNPKKSYTVTFVGGRNGQVILAKLSKTRGEPPKTSELKMGRHFIWKSTEDSLRAEASELELLVDYCFARSIDEMKRREGAKLKAKDDQENKIRKETARRRRDLIIRCAEMRGMMDGNQAQIPDILKCSLEKVISGAETFAKNANTSLEAVTSQASSLNNYYEKYFLNKN